MRAAMAGEGQMTTTATLIRAVAAAGGPRGRGRGSRRGEAEICCARSACLKAPPSHAPVKIDRRQVMLRLTLATIFFVHLPSNCLPENPLNRGSVPILGVVVASGAGVSTTVLCAAQSGSATVWRLCAFAQSAVLRHWCTLSGHSPTPHRSGNTLDACL